MTTIFTSILLTVATTAFAFAHQGTDDTCSSLLTGPGPIEVNAQGEPDLGKQIEEDAHIIADVAHRLGLATPPQQMNIRAN
jgi:hypothetical protein